MGAWDIKNFGNDNALDWVDDFVEEPTIGFLYETIQPVFVLGYLEADVVETALAAIEIVAAAKGKPATDFPAEEIGQDLVALVAANMTPDLVDTCKRAIDRITAERDNELYELWREADQLDPWIAVQTDLHKRVSFYQLRAV